MALKSAEAGEKVRLNGKHLNTESSPTKPRSRIDHTRAGVWDFYEEVEDGLSRIPVAPLLRGYMAGIECVPYVIRMVNDLLNIPGCALLMVAYAATEFVQGLIPVASIWLQGQLLHITQLAIDTRTVDRSHFFRVCIGLILSNVASEILVRARKRIERPLNARIRRWYSIHSFRAHARLDLPTYAEAAIRRQLSDASDNLCGQTVVWQALELATNIVSAAVQLLASVAVLLGILSGQRDGAALVALTLFSDMFYWLPQFSGFWPARVWIATTSNEDYLRMRGWQSAVRDLVYRKELVAGGLARYAISEFKKAADRVGDLDADWHEVEDKVVHRSRSWNIFTEPLKHLPQIYSTFRSTQYATGIPVSLASLCLIQNTTHRFGFTVYEIIQRTKLVGNQLESVKKLYESVNIQNVVPDGTVPFPEETAQLKLGIELEFRNVSFKYPGTEQWVLRNISFKLLPGQLCVIVGANGAGKSTILKLTTRLYDPQEGEIFFGGYDIRTLKLDDIRRCMSVLFQDYTLFPLSIRDNIALGDPTAACPSSSEDHVEQAARLAGAEGFIEKLPKGMDTYLMRPVPDAYSGAIEGTKTFSGRVVSYKSLRVAAGVHMGGLSAGAAGLSGGQMQRLAVARTFMGSVVKEEGAVGLLLFDEPSASLDPAAEHDLFNRLRELKGSKTMLFSSHRFGNLTGYADLILYMDEAGIVESGTHHELLLRKGEYARVWHLQAQAFL